MGIGVWFWIFYALGAVFAVIWGWRSSPEARFGFFGGGLITAILILLLGLAVFGGPIK